MRKRLRERQKQLGDWFDLSREVAFLLRPRGAQREQLLGKLMSLEKSLCRGRWVLKIENVLPVNGGGWRNTPALSVAIAQGGLGYNYASRGFFVKCRFFVYQIRDWARVELVDSDIDFSVPADWLSGMRPGGEKSSPMYQILVGEQNIRTQVSGDSLQWRVEKLRTDLRKMFKNSWHVLRT